MPSSRSDILTIEFPDGARYAVNSHRAARQIWMAAERTAWHFDWNPEHSSWIATKTGDELWSALGRALSQKLGRAATLAPSDRSGRGGLSPRTGLLRPGPAMTKSILQGPRTGRFRSGRARDPGPLGRWLDAFAESNRRRAGQKPPSSSTTVLPSLPALHITGTSSAGTIKDIAPLLLEHARPPRALAASAGIATVCRSKHSAQQALGLARRRAFSNTAWARSTSSAAPWCRRTSPNGDAR